jgi:hypothetical protein
MALEWRSSMNHFAKWMVLVSLCLGSWAQAGEFLEDGGAALGRLDALTFFGHEQKLLYGDQQKSFTYKGSKFYFITSGHKQAFMADPQRFAPQFDGFCALNASLGHRVAANPRVFAIQNGKLYLFSDRESLRRWREDAASNIERAEKAWAAPK